MAARVRPTSPSPTKFKVGLLQTMATRKAISLSTKLAAALLMLRDEHGERLIPHEHAKLMSAEQILSLFQWDHYPIRHEDGGKDEAWNLTPRMIIPHRVKTAKKDAPEGAKGRRLRSKQDEHLRAMAYKLADEIADTVPPPYPFETQKRPRPRSKIPSRPFNRYKPPARQQPKATKVVPRRLTT